MATDGVKIARTIDDCTPHIRARRDFRTRFRKTPYGDFTSMSGYAKTPGRPISTHHLPVAYRAGVTAASYVVFSYDTPIAYWIPTPKDMSAESVAAWLLGAELGQWIVPDVRYTITTTSHQSEVRSALGGHGRWTNDWKPAPAIEYEHFRAEGAPELAPDVGCKRNAY